MWIGVSFTQGVHKILGLRLRVPIVLLEELTGGHADAHRFETLL